MDFHFLVMEKSWKINVEKEGAPCVKQRPVEHTEYYKICLGPHVQT